MIDGTYNMDRVVEESYCRSSLDYQFLDVGDYKLHSTTLMPNIEFDYAEEFPHEIDASIFINDEETKLELEEEIYVQNYLTTKYVGRAPLEFYHDYTKMGRQFLLICRNGDPNYEFRVFGTEDAIRGYNRNANENVLYYIPEGVKETDGISPQ